MPRIDCGWLWNELAEAGVQVIGIDASAPMLTICREKVARLPADVRARIELVESDMRSFSAGDRFGLVTVPYRACLHLLTTQDQRQALTCIREHLLPVGRLIFNVFDPRTDIIQADTGRLGSAVTRDDSTGTVSARRRTDLGSSARVGGAAGILARVESSSDPGASATQAGPMAACHIADLSAMGGSYATMVDPRGGRARCLLTLAHRVPAGA